MSDEDCEHLRCLCRQCLPFDEQIIEDILAVVAATQEKPGYSFVADYHTRGMPSLVARAFGDSRGVSCTCLDPKQTNQLILRSCGCAAVLTVCDDDK